jgi:hypothetical protein
MMIPAVVRLSAGLLVLYGLVIVVWYELIRSLVVDRLRRRRRDDGVGARAVMQHEPMHEDAPAAENGRVGANGHAPVDPAGLDGQELARARRYFYRARQAAQAERDAAIEAANEAAQEAIGRIERRYREIDGAYVEQETDRISEMLLRPPIDGANGSAG